MRSMLSESSRKPLGLPLSLWLRVEHALQSLFRSGAYRIGNTAMSLGLDSFARRYTLAIPSGLVLDVGCGDGYYAKKLEERGSEVVCLDPLEIVVKRTHTTHVVVAVAEYLPFREGCFDFSVAMFSFRDFLDKARGLHEMRRVTRRGVLILDIFNPRDAFTRVIFWVYVKGLAPLLAFLASGVAGEWRLLYPTLTYMPSASIFTRIGGKVLAEFAKGVLALGFIPNPRGIVGKETK